MVLPNIPTALTEAESLFLVEHTTNRVVQECGALLGYSTVLINKMARWVVSVDKHEGYGPSTFRQFMSNIYVHSNRGMEVVVADARYYTPLHKVDTIFIDLDGTEETTFQVLNKSHHPERALVHDVGRQNCNGVERAIKRAGFRIVETVGTLALCVRY